VFADLRGAKQVAEHLRTKVAGNVNVLTSTGERQATGAANAIQLMTCSRLYQQIELHLSSGAAVVVIDAETGEQQLDVSRALLNSKCELLLTHDGSHHHDYGASSS
jgi:hypothetical protein